MTAADSPHRRLHVALVEPEIPWNTGNIGRTCLAVGARLHLVRPLGFSLAERHLRRAGLDYWQHVEPRVWSSWDELEAALPRLGEPYFFSAEGGRDLWSLEAPERTVLVFGRESVGLSPAIRRRYRRRLVAVPIADRRVRSLNLASCAAVAIYEVLRQWSGDTPRA